MLTRWFCVCVLVLMCPAATYGQAFVFQRANYSYLHSPWFQIDGCTYAEGCAFTLSGLVGVHFNEAESSLEWLTTDLNLSGNEELIDDPHLEHAPITGDLVAEFLRGMELTLDSDDGETQKFRWKRGNFELTLNPNSIRLDGGYDSRPADGDGVFFDATGVRTWYGDANLDFKFDSSDLVQVFGAGLYEDGIAKNATWSTGDWNGDDDFDSGDLVFAFEDGGYEKGARKVFNPVPEPSSIVALIAGLIAIAAQPRRYRRDSTF